MEGYSPDGNLNSFGQRIKSYLADHKINVYVSATGGYGFAPTSGKNWSILLTELLNTLTNEEKEAITDVYFCGGFNDMESTADGISNGMTDCYNLCNTINASMHVFMCAACLEGRTTSQYDTLDNLIAVLNNYYESGSSVGSKVNIINAMNVLRVVSFFSSDFVHPNETGQTWLTHSLMNVINGGMPCSYHPEWETAHFYIDPVAKDTNNSLLLHAEAHDKYNGYGGNLNDFTYDFNYLNFTETESHIYDGSTKHVFKIADGEQTFAFNIPRSRTIVIHKPVTYSLVGDANYYNATIRFEITNYKVTMIPRLVSGTGYVTGALRNLNAG